MDAHRLFMLGVVVLLLGIQFRVVESFELNEMATRIVDRRFPRPAMAPVTSYVAQNNYADAWLTPPSTAPLTTRHITPPRKLAFSFISVGAVLILVSPAYRK
jgi:uncharacterized protein YcgI (DUF1989 family)